MSGKPEMKNKKGQVTLHDVQSLGLIFVRPGIQVINGQIANNGELKFLSRLHRVKIYMTVQQLGQSLISLQLQK